MKFKVFCDDRSFRGAYCLHHQVVLMLDAVRTSKTSLNFNVITRLYIPEDFKVQEVTVSVQADIFI
jgi:hypothetical protein